MHAVLRDLVYVLQMLLDLLLQDPLSDTPAVERLDQTLHFLHFGRPPPAAKHLCQRETSAKFEPQSLTLQRIKFVNRRRVALTRRDRLRTGVVLDPGHLGGRRGRTGGLIVGRLLGVTFARSAR